MPTNKPTPAPTPAPADEKSERWTAQRKAVIILGSAQREGLGA